MKEGKLPRSTAAESTCKAASAAGLGQLGPFTRQQASAGQDGLAVGPEERHPIFETRTPAPPPCRRKPPGRL